jgi:phage major capsid protein, HK97 family|nr:MAG TPA: major capsid protein [Caudoviricetes sp.]
MSKALKEQKNELITRAEKILDTAKKEKRELTDAEAQELAEIKDDVKAIKKKILADDIEEMADDKEKKKDDTPKEEEVTEEETTKKEVKEEEKRAFENYLRGKIVHERAGELTKTDNGAVIPTTIVDWIIKKVYDICPILEKSQKYNVKGNLQVPFYPKDSNNITVAYANEFEELTSTSGKFDSVTLTGFLAGALTKVSRSLMNNSQIDIVAFVVDEMAYSIKRFIEDELLNGTDSKVEGLSTLSNGIESASATAITADEVIKLHDAIKDEFQGNAMWIMSPKTRTALRLLKDNMGRYMLQDDISLPFGTSLLGKPVYVSDNMPDMEAGKVAIYYGDMRGLGTKFSEEINIQVLRERFATQHCDGVIGWFEFDAKVVDEQQIAKLTMKSA